MLALVLANLLNNPKLKFKALWRTAIFLPCAVSLVSYSLVFRTLFAGDGFVNDMLMGIGAIDSPINWLGQADTARFVIILGLLWRWTGYNMVFYLAALQNIDHSSIEAARMDGANAFQTFWYVTVPQLKPMIVLTAILSINGTLQLFDESWALTQRRAGVPDDVDGALPLRGVVPEEPQLRLRRGDLVRDPHARRHPLVHPDEGR